MHGEKLRVFYWSKIITATMVCGAIASACSAPPTDGAFSSAGSAGAGQGGEMNGGAGGNGGTTSGSASGGAGGNGGMTSGSASGGAGGNGGMTSGSASGGAGGNGGTCTAHVYDPVPVTLGMYLMLDKSGSMQGQPWTDVTNAIKAFVDQPTAEGIGIGLEFFPAGTCPASCNTDADCGACAPCVKVLPFVPGTCTGSTTAACDVNEYATPAVAIANLPDVALEIKSSIDGTTPSGTTPTSAALDGAIQYTKQWMTMNPNSVGVAIFATDGEPSDCDTNAQNIYNIAAAGLAGTPSVKTYVIGVGTLPFLSELAMAGGTGMPFLVDTNANAQQQFLDAMNSIRGAALSCAYVMPSPPAGEMIDYNAVTLRYTPTNGTTTTIPQVAAPSSCPPNGLAWYYDGNMPPQQILLCPAACAQISADKTGKVDLLAGCVKP